MSQSGLYVVATPIGNLQDISYRAVSILSEVDQIAAEDTRHSRVLLAHYGITTAMLALHDHNEDKVISRLLERIENGESIALISDAGTPLISDPGYRLVKAVREAGLPVFTLPGASAVIAALSVAGIPTDRFAFEGFLPAKPAARVKRLQSLENESATLVFYESSHRIEATITNMVDVFGSERLVALCRELTKKFETVIRAPVGDIKEVLATDRHQTKGEFVIVVSGHQSNEDEAMSSAITMAKALLEYLPASQAARVAAQMNNVPRRDVYKRLESHS